MKYCLMVLFLNLSLFGDEILVTSSGNEVLLSVNGTWKYVTKSQKTDDTFDFKNGKWGQSLESVKLTEKDKLIEESKNALGYETSVAHRKCLGIYYFTKNILTYGGYMFTENHSNDNLYIDDFNSVKALLTEKYGKPKDEFESWSNDIFKKDKTAWGLAVGQGHLSFYASWTSSNSIIRLHLNGDNSQISHMLSYHSKKYEKMVNQERDKKISDGL